MSSTISSFFLIVRSALRCAVMCIALFAGRSAEAQQAEVSGQKYTLSISPPILQTLNMSAQILGNGGEMFLCLTGSVNGKNASVDGYFVPQQTPYADGVDADPESCPKETVAWWHNHPRGRCALSTADINFAVRTKKIPFVVLHVDNTAYCWWTREQVTGLTKNGKQIGLEGVLHPLPGQLIINGSPK